VNGFFWNILLAFAWVGMSGDFSLSTFVLGFALGLVVLFFARRVIGAPQYMFKIVKALELFLFLLWELLLANLRVAYDVLTPGYQMRPGVIALPLDARTDAEITLLANLITLTPGTLSLDVSSDRRVLYIHVMYIDRGDLDGVRRKIKSGFERRVLEVLR
jgi:multicomponent Na+:H+ antiporter subunit E